MRVEEGYISCLDNIHLILLCDTLFIPFHRQFIDSQFSIDPYPTPHLYSVGDDWFPFCPPENNQCDRLNPPPPSFPPTGNKQWLLSSSNNSCKKAREGVPHTWWRVQVRWTVWVSFCSLRLQSVQYLEYFSCWFMWKMCLKINEVKWEERKKSHLISSKLP